MKRVIPLMVLAGLLSFGVQAQLVDGTPAVVPPPPTVYDNEPWEDQLVTSINRDPVRATAYSLEQYQNPAKPYRYSFYLLPANSKVSGINDKVKKIKFKPGDELFGSARR